MVSSGHRAGFIADQRSRDHHASSGLQGPSIAAVRQRYDVEANGAQVVVKPLQKRATLDERKQGARRRCNHLRGAVASLQPCQQSVADPRTDSDAASLRMRVLDAAAGGSMSGVPAHHVTTGGRKHERRSSNVAGRRCKTAGEKHVWMRHPQQAPILRRQLQCGACPSTRELTTPSSCYMHQSLLARTEKFEIRPDPLSFLLLAFQFFLQAAVFSRLTGAFYESLSRAQRELAACLRVRPLGDRRCTDFVRFAPERRTLLSP